MLKFFKLATLAFFIAACSGGDGEVSEVSLENDGLEFFEFFNPFYLKSESAPKNACVINAKVGVVAESDFSKIVDRIINDTGNGIMYSNPVKRNKVVYVAPVDCKSLTQTGAYFPTKYFDQVLSFKKTNASEHPYVADPSELKMKKFVADLQDAAIAAEFDFDHPQNERIGKKQITDLLCVSNANLRAQSRFGLPFTWILVFDHSILYLYNTYPKNTDLVQYLVESGLNECGVNYSFEIRALNGAEKDYLSAMVVERSAVKND